MDFVHNQLATGPRFSYRGEDVVQTLERVCHYRGKSPSRAVQNRGTDHRNKLLCRTRDPRYGRMSQMKQPPEKPGPFRRLPIRHLLAMTYMECHVCYPVQFLKAATAFRMIYRAMTDTGLKT